MTRKNLAYFDGNYGYLTVVSDYDVQEIVTTRVNPDRYIRIGDGTQQLCAGGSRTGPTLTWACRDIAHHFARDCDARLYKTRAGYDRARAKAAS
jgi:hypothetical protein